MVKWQFLIMMVLLFIPVVLGGDVCEDKLIPGENCTMLTPVLNCSANYTLYNQTGFIKEGNMTLLNDSIYYFTFNETEGSYLVKLCDGSTREIIVEDEDMALSVIIGLGIVATLLLYFAFSLDREHVFLKLLLVFLSLGTLLQIPNYLINGGVAGLQTLLKIVLNLIRIFVIYMFLYFNYVLWFKKILIKGGIVK